ncbi:hypothetical protein EJB05_06655, partial [Eragrostis curvula]
MKTRFGGSITLANGKITLEFRPQEAYIANECLTYCSRYFGDDVDTRFNLDRNRETVNTKGVTYDIFKHGARFIGNPLLKFEEDHYEHMVWYVLNNCPEIKPYIKKVREDLQTKYTSNYRLDKALRKEFHGWFKKEIATIKYNRNQHVPHDLEALASQPLLRVKVYSGCIIKDVRYQTIETHSSKALTVQNYGTKINLMYWHTKDGEWVVDEVLPDVQPDDIGVYEELITAPVNSDDEVEDDTLHNYQSDVDAYDDDNSHIPLGDAAAAADDDDDDD